MSAVAVQGAPSSALLRVAEAFARIAAEDPDALVEIAEGWRQVKTADEYGTVGERRMAEAVFEARLDVFVDDHREALNLAVKS